MSYLTNSHRDIVLFIGAGFSKDAGLPVMSEFGMEARKDHKGLAGHISSEEDSREFRYAAPLLVVMGSSLLLALVKKEFIFMSQGMLLFIY